MPSSLEHSSLDAKAVADWKHWTAGETTVKCRLMCIQLLQCNKLQWKLLRPAGK